MDVTLSLPGFGLVRYGKALGEGNTSARALWLGP